MEEVALVVGGTHVRGRLAGPKKATHGALLVHGLGSRLEEFGHMQERLADAGIVSLAIDLRGHGLSDGERGTMGLGHAMADMEVAVPFLRKRLKRGGKLVAVGHSLGAAYVIGAASRTNWFDALVAAHPVDRIFDELNPIEKIGYRALGRWSRRLQKKGKAAGTVLRKPRYGSLFVDKGAATDARSEDFLADRINMQAYTFATTMQASDWATGVKIPALGILSHQDKVVKPAHTRDVLDALAGPVQRIAHRGGHSCWRDLDGERVMEAVVRFVEAQ